MIFVDFNNIIINNIINNKININMSITKSVSFEDEVFDLIRTEQKKSGNGFSKTLNSLLKHLNIEDIKVTPYNRSKKISSSLAKKQLKPIDKNSEHLGEGKSCSKCGKWKLYSEFQKDSSKATKKDPVGHSSQCKNCKNKKEK